MSSGPTNARCVYLVTYSQADIDRVPDRKTFSDMVKDAFEKSGAGNVVEKWCCSREEHADGNPHYHMAVKLKTQRRWLSVRNYLEDINDIKVNFSDGPSNYYEAWLYCSKSDQHILLCQNHPDFTTAPRTSAASSSKRQASRDKQSGSQSVKQRKRSFDALDLSDIVLKNQIKTKTELLSFANRQKKDGKTDIALYVLNNISKAVKIVETTWEMDSAVGNVERQCKTRMEIIHDALNEDCVVGCGGEWKRLAIETLRRNNICPTEFALAIKTALEKGRGKNQNILMVGPTNCGKTFLIKPLSEMYRAFSNPATGSFAWIGVDDCEIIYLNDFRWTEKIISWQDFLRLLEGDKVHIPTPKTHFVQDIILHKDTPIFCTTPHRFRSYFHGVVNEIETEMMEVRWKTFSFFYQLGVNDTIDIPPCSKCFAELILQ